MREAMSIHNRFLLSDNAKIFFTLLREQIKIT